jgi:hypothetical protein
VSFHARRSTQGPEETDAGRALQLPHAWRINDLVA